MKLKDKLTIAREIAVWQLQEMRYEDVMEHSLAADLPEELWDDIHELITNAIAVEVRGN